MLIIILFSACQPKSTIQIPDKSLADKVNVHIGAISHMLVPTYPTVHVPNSMVRLYPYTTPGINDHYLAPRIYGFPVNIPSHRHAPLSLIMATSDPDGYDSESTSSKYNHEMEEATPYYYQVFLIDPGVNVEYSASEHGAAYRFTKKDEGELQIVIKVTGSGSYVFNEDEFVKGTDAQRNVKQFFTGKFSSQPSEVKYLDLDTYKLLESPQEVERSGIVFNFNISKQESVILRYGISYISTDQSEINLAKELADRTFEEIINETKGKWESMLGKIKVEGGSEDQQAVFYTSLYRCFERMINLTEDDQYYSPFDREIHKAGDHDFYVDDWSWDTYRTLHPLRTLLIPEKENDMISSYIRAFEQSGWMPAFPTIFGDMGAMIGHHQAAIISDGWFKGIREFDIDKAYEGLRKNAMQGTRIPWREGPMVAIDRVYLEKGFFPALPPGEPESVAEVSDFEDRQAVAVTLEHAYDDWCLSRLAEDLGKNDDADRFFQRGLNYRLLYNPEIGFCAPKDASGNWIVPYNPKAPAGVGGRAYFAESNAWTYTWHVQHDLSGLIYMIGGKEKADERLDQLFNEPLDQSKWTYLGYMPDATGLTGVFPMGNEPSFHVPYIYNFTGSPWKAQERTRQLMNSWFRNDLMGVCGDEDGGAMSAWYVFTSIGLYPITPGIPAYVIGSPVFEKTVIQVGGQKSFTITAREVSNSNKYIQSASLNGQALNVPWVSHESLIKGGELILEMGPTPNRQWASDADFKSFRELK